MSKPSLDSPPHVRLRDFRVAPTFLEPLLGVMDELTRALYADVLTTADKMEPLLSKTYDAGFRDGQAAALLELDRSESNQL